jgi:hypothetical protein
MEWGIGGFKGKWRFFVKMFNSTKPEYSSIELTQ